MTPALASATLDAFRNGRPVPPEALEALERLAKRKPAGRPRKEVTDAELHAGAVRAVHAAMKQGVPVLDAMDTVITKLKAEYPGFVISRFDLIHFGSGKDTRVNAILKRWGVFCRPTLRKLTRAAAEAKLFQTTK
jgi:hypothetical protein